MIEITKENFEAEVKNSDIPVVLDFWAPWCGPCRAVTPVLENLEGEFAGQIKVAKINIDEQRTLATAFRVQSIPTIIVMDKGELTDTSVGFRGEGPLRAMIQTALKGAAEAAAAAGAEVTDAKTGGSYYKVIDGKKYDREILEFCDKAVEGAGDGRISQADAEKLLALVKDGDKYTEIEKDSVKHARENFKWTDAADEWFRTEIRKWAATK